MENDSAGPLCIICFEGMKGKHQCCIYPVCGHSVCKICSEKVERCPSCKHVGRPSPISYFEEIEDESDLVCQFCDVWFGEEIFYPVFINTGNDVICNLCSMKEERGKTRPVKFFSLAQFSSQMKMATQRKLDSCPHSIENHVYCLSHHVHFCKLCYYNSFSIHRSHNLLFGDDIKKEEEKEVKEIRLLFDKDEKEGIIGFLAEFASSVKETIKRVSLLLSISENEISKQLNLKREPLLENALSFNEKFQQFRRSLEKNSTSSDKKRVLSQLKYMKEKLYIMLVRSNRAFIYEGKLKMKFEKILYFIVGLHEMVGLEQDVIKELKDKFLVIFERPVTHFVKKYLTQIKPIKFKAEQNVTRRPVVQNSKKVSYLIPEVDQPCSNDNDNNVNIEGVEVNLDDLSDDSS